MYRRSCLWTLNPSLSLYTMKQRWTQPSTEVETVCAPRHKRKCCSHLHMQRECEWAHFTRYRTIFQAINSCWFCGTAAMAKWLYLNLHPETLPNCLLGFKIDDRMTSGTSSQRWTVSALDLCNKTMSVFGMRFPLRICITESTGSHFSASKKWTRINMIFLRYIFIPYIKISINKTIKNT